MQNKKNIFLFRTSNIAYYIINIPGIDQDLNEILTKFILDITYTSFLNYKFKSIRIIQKNYSVYVGIISV